MKRTATGALADCCNFVRISSKSTDELLNPLEGGALVVETIVSLIACLAEFFRCHKTSDTETVASDC